MRLTKNKPPRINLFWVALGAGFLLGILMLIQGFLTYTYVMDHLVPDHLTGEAAFHVAQIENRARRQEPETAKRLESLLEIREGESRSALEHMGAG